MKTKMQDFKDEVSKIAHGITKAEAIEKCICIDCKERVDGRIFTKAGLNEYFISGYCEVCFDKLFEED